MLASCGPLLFLILIIIIFLHHAYCTLCRRRRSHDHDGGSQSFFRRVYTVTSSPATAQNRGLDPSLLKYLPTFTYSSDTHRPLTDCAICLSEFHDDDEGRVLPNCSHGFHSHCVDAWFSAHSVCPMCRSFVQPLKVLSQNSVSADKIVHCSDLPPAIWCSRKSPVLMESTSIIIMETR